MCGHCGCGEEAATTVLNLQTGKQATMERGAGHAHDYVHEHGHDDPHGHGHEHGHDHGHADSGGTPARELVELETRILAKNDAIAEKNRAWFKGREILALNLIEFAWRRQDDAARADHSRTQGRDQAVRRRRRPGYRQRWETHSRRRRGGGPGQHRLGLSSRGRHGGARIAGA